MTQDELIDKILQHLFRNSNTALDFYDEFSSYENDINKLENAKSSMEREGLITEYKNKKTGITPLGFRISYDGGYLDEKNRKERAIKKRLNQNKIEITYLKKSLKSKNQTNSVLLILLILSLVVIVLSMLGLFNLNLT